MSYKIVWKRRAKRFLKDLQKQDVARIQEAVEDLADRSPETWRNVIALTKHVYQYRLRVGDYRVLFDIQKKVEILDVQEVGRRNEQTY